MHLTVLKKETYFKEKLDFGLMTPMLGGFALLVWLLIQMKIEFDNYKQLHTSLLNFNSITYYERSYGFFCLLVSVFLLIFVHIVIPRNVGSYPVIVITRLGAIDFMLITFISRSSKISFKRMWTNTSIYCF